MERKTKDTAQQRLQTTTQGPSLKTNDSNTKDSQITNSKLQR
ncbi:hypothetical protein COLO4_33834 [Corchorus olitorius]|uniref:Uncharacterized protein n=1 Tax=Corchorus olitorius TaxID=93759 RepID=A0A1R3GQV2_9ROSI|nr:hypothetical protein COLO4_33834 [Corchorus olitorius]